MATDRTRTHLGNAALLAAAGLTLWLAFALPRLLLGGIGRVFSGRW